MAGRPFVEFGNLQAKGCWVYLCGLTESFDSPDEQNHRLILSDIGNKLNIRFVAPQPCGRSPKFNDKLCWPMQDLKQTMETYLSILTDLQGLLIEGWIGFSNGGYFLYEISRQKLLNVPIIIIGATESLDLSGQIYIMIGKQDRYEYERAKNLKCKIIEYEGGHSIDGGSLEQTLKLIVGKSSSG